MKVCSCKGLSIVIMLRDEHCPPHVHVNAGSWSARLQFSFWHNDIELWDVVPLSRSQSNEVLTMRLVTDTTYRVGSARYEAEEGKTLLTLIGALEGVEIEL